MRAYGYIGSAQRPARALNARGCADTEQVPYQTTSWNAAQVGPRPFPQPCPSEPLTRIGLAAWNNYAVDLQQVVGLPTLFLVSAWSAIPS